MNDWYINFWSEKQDLWTYYQNWIKFSKNDKKIHISGMEILWSYYQKFGYNSHFHSILVEMALQAVIFTKSHFDYYTAQLNVDSA